MSDLRCPACGAELIDHVQAAEYRVWACGSREGRAYEPLFIPSWLCAARQLAAVDAVMQAVAQFAERRETVLRSDIQPYQAAFLVSNYSRDVADAYYALPPEVVERYRKEE